MTLRRLGISFRTQDESELRLHVVVEDPRYPMLCVNGDLNFGVSINPQTGDIEGGRGCICASRTVAGCICDLLPNHELSDGSAARSNGPRSPEPTN